MSDRLRLIEEIKSKDPVSLRSIDGRIPRDLETIVRKAIDKEPARRYSSAEAMAEELVRFLEDELDPSATEQQRLGPPAPGEP